MMIDPTPEQAEHAGLVQGELIEMFNRLRAEGIDPSVIIAGIAAGTAAVVMHNHGPATVPRWFAKQAAITMHMDKLAN